MRMNQESRCPSEYYSSNLYRKRYPRKTRCIIKSGNIFCSRMRHVRMQNGPRTSVSVSGKWSCIFCESPSPFANNCILWFIKVFSNLYSHFLHFIRIFFIQLHRKKISRCYLLPRICTLKFYCTRFVYHLHLENWKRNIYILKIKVYWKINVERGNILNN